MKGHGKVDVLVDSNYITETKNYLSINNLEFVYKQVLHRMHHCYPYVSIVLLINGFQKNKFKQKLKDIDEWINSKNGKKQNLETNFEKENFFIVEMRNPDTDCDFLLSIACYHLEFNRNHAKDNKDINVEESEEIKNQSREFVDLLGQINKFDFKKHEQIEKHIDKLKEEFWKIIDSYYEYNEYFLKPSKNDNIN